MEIRFPLILDGATGTELQKRGYTGESCAEQWVLEHPETIREVQRGQPGRLCADLRRQPPEARGARHHEPDGGI